MPSPAGGPGDRALHPQAVWVLVFNAILGLAEAELIGAAKTADLSFSGNLIAESTDLLTPRQGLGKAAQAVSLTLCLELPPPICVLSLDD